MGDWGHSIRSTFTGSPRGAEERTCSRWKMGEKWGGGGRDRIIIRDADVGGGLLFAGQGEKGQHGGCGGRLRLCPTLQKGARWEREAVQQTFQVLPLPRQRVAGERKESQQQRRRFTGNNPYSRFPQPGCHRRGSSLPAFLPFSLSLSLPAPPSRGLCRSCRKPSPALLPRVPPAGWRVSE